MKLKALRRSPRQKTPTETTRGYLGLLLASLAAGGLLSSCDEPSAKQEAPAPENKEATPAPAVWPEKPLAEDVEAYRAASAKGDHGATCLLARCYINGTGVEKDEQEGFLLLHKAAEAGHAEAQWRLGYCYQNGCGTAVNDEKALKWWRMAEAQGESEALLAIGFSYGTGRGVAKDDQQATEYYRRAAEAGNIHRHEQPRQQLLCRPRCRARPCRGRQVVEKGI